MDQKGILITFEGGDGAGKSTLIQKVFAELQSKQHPVIRTFAPGATAIGQSIRELLLCPSAVPMSKRCELLLFLSDRAQHVDECILPALQQGKVILCDRFNDSTMAYQSGARGFDPSWVRELCEFACNKVQPDLTFYLDLDPVIGLTRVKKIGAGTDRIESETLEFHQTIRQAFHRIAKLEPQRLIMLDASQSPEHVFQQAIEKMHAFFPFTRQ